MGRISTAYHQPYLLYDFPEVRVGTAVYEDGPTGCTVFHFPRKHSSCYPAYCVLDIRGGIPGLVNPIDDCVSAICFVGGSLMGLEAVSGVNEALREIDGYSHEIGNLPLVTGACIHDYAARGNAVSPDRELGHAAALAARDGIFPCGLKGAGIGATVGKLFVGRGDDIAHRVPSGQGGAYRAVGAIKLAVFTVVNALGYVIGAGDEKCMPVSIPFPSLDRETLHMMAQDALESTGTHPHQPGNTTLTLVLTNVALGESMLRQLARQVHAGLAAVIEPFDTPQDGDVLFCVSTRQVPLENAEGILPPLGMICTRLAREAVFCCFRR